MLERVDHPSGLVVFRSPALRGLGVPHLFTTRVGPAGDLCLRSVEPATRDLLLEASGQERGLDWSRLRQVHGRAVVEVDGAPPAPGTEGDALVTGRPRRPLLVVTADCVPVLIASDDGAHVAAVHAGWRGILAGVVPAALERLGAAPAVAAIGACLGAERCEMGPEVVEQFEAAGLGAHVQARPGRRARVDVRAAVHEQLERGGVGSIDVSDACTWDDARLFHSYRRDVTHGSRDRAGSLGALIAARA